MLACFTKNGPPFYLHLRPRYCERLSTVPSLWLLRRPERVEMDVEMHSAVRRISRVYNYITLNPKP